MRLTLAFVMDPLAQVNIDTDTTFSFMLAAQARGHRVIYVPPSGIGLTHAQCFLRGREVTVQSVRGKHYEDKGEVRLLAKDAHAVFIRTDPPFDDNYLAATWMLSFAEAQGARVINSPRGIRNANEKLYALEFPELCPPTLVTASRDDVKTFVQQHGDSIAKPLDGHGGFGVFRLRPGDSNIGAIVDMLSREGRRPLLVQEYLPAIKDGDRRLLLIDGELRGAVTRLPQEGDHRGNVHVGGKVVACAIEPRDRDITARLAPKLRADGLFFVGLDVIGGMLIEVNVTSPTLVQQLRDLGGPDLATEVIKRVERMAPPLAM